MPPTSLLPVGKSPLSRDCVVADVVALERVSSLQFWDMQGDSSKMQGSAARGLGKNHHFSMGWMVFSLLRGAGRPSLPSSDMQGRRMLNSRITEHLGREIIERALVICGEARA
jgi:hypothetical protein